MNFRPTEEMQQRLQTLIARSEMGQLTSQEKQDLDQYERIEHLVIMLKAGNMPYLSS